MTQWREILQMARHVAGPVLIYGPTASGKSALALRLAEELAGVVINADASQVWSNWHVLTARPGAADLARAPHALYGHLAHDAAYSAGRWLREVARHLNAGPRAIIVGGTGLYFKSLVEGLVDIPETPAGIRAEADALRLGEGHGVLRDALDPETRARIDPDNPMRVQRAWEVLRTTGRGLAAWQDDTPAPLVPLDACLPIHVHAPRDWLTPRIDRRFDDMLAAGALDEAQDNLTDWNPERPSMKVIGARELVAHLGGELSLDAARARAVIATRQYAKRQRTWGRARMRSWHVWEAELSG